jgi:hypothetical protein
MDEQILIGNQNRMIIRDGVVHRPSHPWSDGIRRPLQFCRTEGLKFVPEWRVKMNRETRFLSFI